MSPVKKYVQKLVPISQLHDQYLSNWRPVDLYHPQYFVPLAHLLLKSPMLVHLFSL